MNDGVHTSPGTSSAFVRGFRDEGLARTPTVTGLVFCGAARLMHLPQTYRHTNRSRKQLGGTRYTLHAALELGKLRQRLKANIFTLQNTLCMSQK